LLLLENGVIEYQAGERTLKSTDKGIHFLRIHDSYPQVHDTLTFKVEISSQIHISAQTGNSGGDDTMYWCWCWCMYDHADRMCKTNVNCKVLFYHVCSMACYFKK